MDQKDMFKQVIDFHKNTFNNSFNAMVMLQDQNDKMLDAFLGQAGWVPQDLKKILAELASNFKKGRDEFKKNVDDNFKKVEEYLSPAVQPQGKGKQQ